MMKKYVAYKIRIKGILKKSKRTYIHNYVKDIYIEPSSHGGILYIVEKARGGIPEKVSKYRLRDIEKIWRKEIRYS